MCISWWCYSTNPTRQYRCLANSPMWTRCVAENVCGHDQLHGAVHCHLSSAYHVLIALSDREDFSMVKSDTYAHKHSHTWCYILYVSVYIEPIHCEFAKLQAILVLCSSTAILVQHVSRSAADSCLQAISIVKLQCTVKAACMSMIVCMHVHVWLYCVLD